MNVVINDCRNFKDFNKTTFSGYKKSQVLNTLSKSLVNSNIEESCFWSAEIICSGYFIELWEIIILFINKFINIGNPKLSVYIDKNINNFKTIANTYSDELNLRNNENIRKLFSEIICVLCKSNRKHPLSENKIDQSHYVITNIGDKLKVPNNTNFIQSLFKPQDIKEVYIGLNELYYNIKELKNTVMSCYWIDWIIDFDILLRKNKLNSLCAIRNYTSDPKNQSNVVWIIWDIFFDLSNKNNVNHKIISSLLTLFNLKFTSTTPKKRKYILYNCVSLLTENVNYDIPIIEDTKYITIVNENIFKIYKQIKANEKNNIDISMPIIKNKKNINDSSLKKMQMIDNFFK